MTEAIEATEYYRDLTCREAVDFIAEKIGFEIETSDETSDYDLLMYARLFDDAIRAGKVMLETGVVLEDIETWMFDLRDDLDMIEAERLSMSPDDEWG